jgi:transposase
MDIVFERCAGLDVHKRTVVACVLTPHTKEVRSFGTVTAELLRLADWLQEQDVSDVAMESTGVYWQPVHNVLEDRGFAADRRQRSAPQGGAGSQDRRQGC